MSSLFSKGRFKVVYRRSQRAKQLVVVDSAKKQPVADESTISYTSHNSHPSTPNKQAYFYTSTVLHPFDQLFKGKSINITTGGAALATIDTGTTLLGGPSADVNAIWNSISGSKEEPDAYGNPTGLFSFPCSTNVEVTLSFGGNPGYQYCGYKLRLNPRLGAIYICFILSISSNESRD
ncbi:hypothetical protein BDQ17DRAFT_1329409 [Cyathus striatus]|nr:hypothetical protein BDQ17DRAFT_1329409 [Cyathus striatus]